MNIAIVAKQKHTRNTPKLLCEVTFVGDDKDKIRNLPHSVTCIAVEWSNRPSYGRAISNDGMGLAQSVAQARSVPFFIFNCCHRFYEQAKKAGVDATQWAAQAFWSNGLGCDIITKMPPQASVEDASAYIHKAFVAAGGDKRKRWTFDAIAQAIHKADPSKINGYGVHDASPKPDKVPDGKRQSPLVSVKQPAQEPVYKPVIIGSPTTTIGRIKALVQEIVHLMPDVNITEIEIVGTLVQVKRTEMRPVEVKEDW